MPILNKNNVSVPDEFGTGGVMFNRITKINPNSGMFSVTVPEHLKNMAVLVYLEQVFECADKEPTDLSAPSGTAWL